MIGAEKDEAKEAVKLMKDITRRQRQGGRQAGHHEGKKGRGARGSNLGSKEEERGESEPYTQPPCGVLP